MTMRLPKLPPPYQPFVVRDDFIVRADLFPLPGTYNGRLEERHFELDDQYERYLRERLASFTRSVEPYRCIDPADPVALAEVYSRLFAILGREHPDYIVVSGEVIELCLLGLKLDLADRQNVGVSLAPDAPGIGREVARWLDAQVGLARFGDALALACQEDIVIMQIRDDGSHNAESLHVLLPSTWNPREKYQQSFARIHEPVAESSRLIASSDNVMKAMVIKGPYVRFGLSLTTRPELDSHPDHCKPWNSAWLDDVDLLASTCIVRIERQTTFPIPDLRRALFTVRIYNTPLIELADSRPDLLPRLATILRSASPAVLTYKGIDGYAGLIASWCEYQSERLGSTNAYRSCPEGCPGSATSDSRRNSC